MSPKELEAYYSKLDTDRLIAIVTKGGATRDAYAREVVERELVRRGVAESQFGLMQSKWERLQEQQASGLGSLSATRATYETRTNFRWPLLFVAAAFLVGAVSCGVFALTWEGRRHMIVVSPLPKGTPIEAALEATRTDHTFQFVDNRVVDNELGYFPMSESEVRAADPDYLSVRRYVRFTGKGTGLTIAELLGEKEHAAFVDAERTSIRILWVLFGVALATSIVVGILCCGRPVRRRPLDSGSC